MAESSTLNNNSLMIGRSDSDYAELDDNHLVICYDDYPYIELYDRDGGFQWIIKNENQVLSFIFSE